MAEQRKISGMQKLGLAMAAFGQGMTGQPFASNIMSSWQKQDEQAAENEYRKQVLRQNEGELAAKGVRWDEPTGRFVRDESLVSPLEQMIQAGQVADAQVKLAQLGITPGTSGVKAPVNPTFGIPPTPDRLPLMSDVAFPDGTWIPKELNALGKPTGYKMNPAAEKQLEKQGEMRVEAQKGLSNTKLFLDQFGRSYNELKAAYPEIGKEGYGGWATRKKAWLQTSLDKFPETKAFRAELKKLANQTARDVEGGRVTDQDRQVYADSFANVLSHPTQTNVRLVSNGLNALKAKGGDVTSHVKELYNSEIDIMRSIASEVMKSNPDVALSVLGLDPNRYEVVK